MNNSRLDHFDAGSTAGSQITHMPIAAIKRLPSGDAPGHKVASVVSAYRGGTRVAPVAARLRETPYDRINPLTVKDGVLVDGHTRVAAAEEIGLKTLPVRHTPRTME